MPAIGVAAAALALSACGIAAGISGGMPVDRASVGSAPHAPGNTGFADLTDLAQVKRDVAGNAVERARAQQAPTDASPFADLRDLAQVKRDAAWAGVQRAHSGGVARQRPAACTSLSDVSQVLPATTRR
jgi:hypothetical protein